MNNDELFINEDRLPNPLSKEEVYQLLIKIQNGDEKAKQILIMYNIRLVLNRVNKKFKLVQYDKKDLVSIGIIGLVKAIDNFDMTKNLEFSTYATIMIDGEIKYFLKKLKKIPYTFSFDEPIGINKKGNSFKLEDILIVDEDIVEEYLKNEKYLFIRKTIDSLSEFDRKVIIMYFGFDDDKLYRQVQIAQELNTTQAKVSRTIIRVLKQIKLELIRNGFAETNLFENNLVEDDTFKSAYQKII